MTDLFNFSEADAANQMMRLARQIKRANKKYHAEDAPEMSDAEYDALVAKYRELAEAYPSAAPKVSPLESVGAPVDAAR